MDGHEESSVEERGDQTNKGRYGEIAELRII